MPYVALENASINNAYSNLAKCLILFLIVYVNGE